MKKHQRSKFKIIARQIALEAVRNSHLETLHGNLPIPDSEMRTLMLEIEENLRISLWYWITGKKYNNTELLSEVERVMFGEYGISWDNPKLNRKKKT